MIGKSCNSLDDYHEHGALSSIYGSGIAGKIIVWTLASQGQKTIVAERAMVRVSCPNVACMHGPQSSAEAWFCFPLAALGCVAVRSDGGDTADQPCGTQVLKIGQPSTQFYQSSKTEFFSSTFQGKAEF